LGGLLIALILFVTVVTALIIGIAAAYAALTGILYAFVYQSRQRVRRIPLLVPREAHAGGD